MYRILKGRSFGPQTSFGPQIGWRGPGEGFGQGALFMHEGDSSTSVCMSDSGMTFLIDRRECERIMDQLSRCESGYSPALHGKLLEESPKSSPSINSVTNFFKQFESKFFHGMSELILSHIVQECELVKMKAGDVLEHEDDQCTNVYVVCYGTLSAHANVRSPAIQHFMPIKGECLDVLGPGCSFGACGYVGSTLRAREVPLYVCATYVYVQKYH